MPKYAGGYTMHINLTEQTVLPVFNYRLEDNFNNHTPSSKFIEVFPWVLHQQSYCSEVCGLKLATERCMKKKLRATI